MSDYSLIVIGGGAAGFFGAITAAEKMPLGQVLLIEVGQVLSKVKISGGGRCNVTHSCFEPSELVQNYPRGGQALRGAFTRFQPRDTMEWFTSRGVELKIEEDGRVFPVTDNSQTIIDCLVNEAKELGVKIWTGTSVVDVVKSENGFTVRLKSHGELTSDRLLIATGSHPSGYKLAQNLGHTIIPPVPSLFTFNIDDPRIKDLAGITVKQVTVKLAEANNKTVPLQVGPLLITHWGMSGPAILKLSAWGARFLHDRHYQSDLIVNWLPDFTIEKLRSTLGSVKNQLPQKLIKNTCPLPLPHRLWESLIHYCNIDNELRWAGLSNQKLNGLINELNQGRYLINGKGIFKEEFVTCGGVSLKEVNFKTMESKICPGLYFAGEILDIDGVTGGFNFQNAWTTGWLFGNN